MGLLRNCGIDMPSITDYEADHDIIGNGTSSSMLNLNDLDSSESFLASDIAELFSCFRINDISY